MKPIVLYHSNCTDGFTAAWCFHHAGPDVYDFQPVSYGKPSPDVAGRVVFIVDFSYPRDELLAMAEQAQHITVLDHHASAERELASLAHSLAHPRLSVHFDMQRSGAGMAWDYLFPGVPRPLFLGYVEDRDLWRFRFADETRASHALLGSVPQTFETWDAIMLGDAVEQLHYLAQGAALVRLVEKQVQDAVAASRRDMLIGATWVPTANVPGFLASDAGHLMGADAPFAATYYDTPERRCFSLRSRPDGADVSLIAKQYGGGGHVHAAGFSVPREHDLARA